MKLSRRHFIAGLSASAAAFATRDVSAVAEPLYPPTDLSVFRRPITPAPAEIRFGYHAITWGDDNIRAIREIAELGFRGIQLRTNIFKDVGKDPARLRDLLAQYKLQFVALSSGGVQTATDANEEVRKHVDHARFVRDAGGLYLQVTDAARPPKGAPTAEDFKRLGRLLTEIGRRTADLGIPLGYHNHMHSLGEAPDEVDRILDSADPRYVKLELDVAHYHQGGGDPVRAIKRYRDRLLFFHIKDVEPTGPDGRRDYRFVELGRGRVDLPGVFAAMREVNFRGWAIIELDAVPDKSRTPRDSALISKRYVEERLGIKV